MKISNILLIIVSIICVSLGSAFGAVLEKDSIELQDSMTKKNGIYPVINTLINGKELETDVPGVIVKSNNVNVPYVPVSTIFRSMGATTSWSETAKRLTIKSGKNTYVFNVGRAEVSVNGKIQLIDGGHRIMLLKYAGTDRTMVPADALAKHLGMEMKYQPEVRTVNLSQPLAKVQGMTYRGDGKYKEIRVKTSTEISIKSYNIDGTAYGGKSKVIVEFQNSILETGVQTAIKVEDTVINRIDLVNPSKVPPRIRLEVELNSPYGFYTYYDKASKEQVVQIVNTLKDIKLEKDGDNQYVSIKTTVKPQYKVKTLQGKLVVDVLDTKLTYNNGSASEIPVLTYGLIGISYSQFDPSAEYAPGDLVSRVVLNFADGNQQEKAYVKEMPDGLRIYIKGDPDKGIRYNKSTSSSSVLNFEYAADTEVKKTLNAESGELQMLIPKSAIMLENVFRNYNDNIVQYVDVNANVNSEQYLITVKMAPGTVVFDNSNARSTSVAFINETIENSSNQKTLIVLDAGHGGSDPGTIGKFTGAKEKDLALKAVYALKDELERSGFEVALTRSNDSRVELLQRTDLANEINARLFISIHYNAAEKTDVSGIEVLYYPDATGEKYKFANALYGELIESTGARARGVIKRPNLVVPRETRMPSALIEMGFVSNRDEEIKVQNPDYMNVQIKAIVEGVKIYLGSN